MKPRMTLGWTQFLVVIFGLCTVAVATDILCGEPYTGLAEEIARVACLDYQQEFGFEIAPITVPTEVGERTWLGIARVTPGGRFDRAGIRAGDFVFTQHGGQFSMLHWALRSAAAGEMACLDLHNVEQRRAQQSSVRIACIGPAVPCRRSGDWDRVLALAARPLSESREALQHAAADRTTDAGRLAVAVLAAADTQQPAPRLLSRVSLSLGELRIALDTPRSPWIVAARVDVDARGCAARVALRDHVATDRLAPVVVDALQRAVYVPAKPAGAFATGSTDVSMFVDPQERHEQP